MTVAGASYSINHNRIRRGLYPGFELKEDGTLILDPREGIHMLYLRAIDEIGRASCRERVFFGV